MRRLAAVDMARGIAMLFMLVNHATWKIPEINLGVNYGWNLPAPAALDSSIAWINLFQGTPVFMLLTGFGVALFEASRIRKGWTPGAITRYFMIRGAVLLLIDICILPWTFQYPVLAYQSRFFVLSAIAVCLWMLAAVRTLRPAYLLILAALLTVFTQIIYRYGPPDDTNLLRSLLLYPSATDPLSIGFPVLAWFPVIVFGYTSGIYLMKKPDAFTRYTFQIGSSLMLLWLVSCWSGVGRLVDGHWLLLHKHPPDVAYLGFNVGWSFLLLALLSRLRPVPMLATLGQSALAFYVLHWYIVLLIAAPLSSLFSGVLLYVLVCCLALVVLYPLCVQYRTYRANHLRYLQYV